MTCGTGSKKYTPAQKKQIGIVYKYIQDDNNSVTEKINAIDNLQEYLENKTVFIEVKNLLVLQDQRSKKAKTVELNAKEKDFANMVEYGTKTAPEGKEQAKAIMKPFMLDGVKYIVVHSENEVRVVDTDTMEDLETFQTNEADIAKRNENLLEETSSALVKQFDIKQSTLGGRIVNTLRETHKIKNNEIPIERRIIKEKRNVGLFASLNQPLSKLNLLLNGDENTKPDVEAYLQGIADITEFIPQNIKNMLLGDKSPAQNKEFMDNMQHFLNIYDSLNMPIEETWRNNFKLKENGDLVQIWNSKYISPNYLTILGKFETVDNEAIAGKKNATDKIKQSDQLVLDPAIEEIVKFYTVKAMADMKEMIENLNGKDISEIARALNVDVNTAYKLKNEFIEQNTIPVSSFISDAAKDAYNQLGITTSSSVNMDIKDGLLASLKSLISATLINSDYITYDNKSTEQKEISKRADEMKKDPNEKKTDAEINAWVKEQYGIIKNKYDFGGKNFAMYTLNTDQFGTSDAKTGEKHLNEMNKAFNIVNKLKYLNINEKRKVPTLEPIAGATNTILNSSYNANPDIKKFRTEQNQVAWRYKEDFDELYQAYQDTLVLDSDSKEEIARKEALREELLIGLGKKVVDTDKQHVSELKVIMSNNDKIERELEVLMSMYPTLKGKDFYLEWVETASGRATIASDMQPQESKLIRSFIEQPTQAGELPGHNIEMNIEDFDAESDAAHMLEMALAQAFDMDPDKNSKATILKDIRKVVDITGSGVTIKTDTKLGKALDMVVTGSGTSKERAKAMNVIFEEGEGHHGLQAARMLKRLKTWKESDMSKSFNNDLTIETDAITSGMILTLMQIVDDTAIEFLAKGGIYNEDTKATWTEYTKKWLKLKYDMTDTQYDMIEFGPAGLIEAGNFHQALLENANIEIHGDKKPANKALTQHFESFTGRGKLKKAERTFIEDAMNDVHTTEVFQDLYKTIGIEMQGAVEEKALEIKNQLNATDQTIALLKMIEQERKLNDHEKQQLASAEKLYDRLKLQDAMLAKIGTITPKKLRAIAKDPVMTYIYGSMIASIRKNLGGTVGVAHFVDSIKIKHELESKEDAGVVLEPEEQEALNIANTFVNATLKAVDRRTSFGRKFPFDTKKSLKYKELDPEGRIVPRSYFEDTTTSEHEALMNLELDDNIVGVLTKAVNDTFGDAIANAFEAKTGSVDTYRDMMKTVELITFELFRARTETYKKELLEKYDGVIPDFEFRDMLKGMEERGEGPDAPTGDSETTDKRLPMLNMEVGSNTKEASATIRFNKKDLFDEDGNLLDENVNEQTRAYAYLTGREFVSNTGAAPTTTIHQMDSRGITVTVSGNSWLSIYDAVVQASEPVNVKHVNDTYNSTIFEQNSQRDILGDNTRKMTKMLQNLIERKQNGDKTAVNEFNEIMSRLRSSEEIGYMLYTHETESYKKDGTMTKAQIVVPKLVDINPKTRTGKLYMGMKAIEERESLYVDTLAKKYADGTMIIKEVYYSMPKKNNKKKSIARTVTKTIKDEQMKVVVIDRQNVKKADGTGEDQKIWTAYKMEYNVYGKDEVARHNNRITNKNIKFTENDIIDIPELDLVEVDIQKNDQKLLNIIEMDEDIKVQTIDGGDNNQAVVRQEGKIYAKTLAGSDFKNESKRLSLPLMAIINNIENSEAFMKRRFDNLSKYKWSIGHSNVSDTVPVGMGNGKGKLGKIEVQNVLKLLKTIQNKNVQTNYKYIEQNLNKVDNSMNDTEGQLFKDTQTVAKAGYEIAKAAGSDMFVTGGDPKVGHAEMFDGINLHNTNYYTEDSILTVLPASEGKLSIDYGNKLGYGFDGLEKAIKTGTKVVTQNTNNEIYKIMQNAKLDGETDIDVIMIQLRRNGSKEKLHNEDTNYELERKIAAYQINAYMKSKDYTVKVENGYNVWTTEFMEVKVNGKKKKVPMHTAKKEMQKILKKVC